MSVLWTVFRKELLDAFRDRRMMIVAFLVMPLAVPLVLAGMTTLGARKQVEKMEATLDVPVIGAQYAPNLIAWLASNNLRIVPAPANAEADVREQAHEVVLRIDPRFAVDWRAGQPARVELIFDSSRPMQSGTAIHRVRGLLAAYDKQMGLLRLIARGVHPAIASPLRISDQDIATPESRFDMAQQLLPYLLLLMAFVGGMQLAIDSTAGERERHSLEPLLTTPASREAIISGKILATAAFTVLSIVVTLVAYRLAFSVMPNDQAALSLDVPLAALARVFVVILPIVLLGATLLTALAAFARSYREAQGYLPLLIFLPMIPTLFLMVAPVRTQLWMLAVPFLSQNQLILRVLRSESVTAAEWAVSVGSASLLAAIAWYVAARLYHREQLAAST
jgi:sodium transport system permease protein